MLIELKSLANGVKSSSTLLDEEDSGKNTQNEVSETIAYREFQLFYYQKLSERGVQKLRNKFFVDFAVSSLNLSSIPSVLIRKIHNSLTSASN